MQGRSRRDVLVIGSSLLTTSLAGCSGDSGPDLSAEDYPPGTSEDGIDDPDRLAQNTRRVIENNGYDVTLGKPDKQFETQYRSSLTNEVQSREIKKPGNTVSVYINGSKILLNDDDQSDVDFYTINTDNSFATFHAANRYINRDYGYGEGLLFPNVIKRFNGAPTDVLGFGEFKPVETAEHNGTTVLRLELESVDAETVNIDGDIAEVSGSVAVGSDSVIYEAASTIAVESENGPQVEWDHEFAIQKLGTVDVSEPSWVDPQEF